MKKQDLLKDEIQHIDITSFDSTTIINAMRKMSFSSRDTAVATDILMRTLSEKDTLSVLVLAGSTSAGGCMKVYADMIKYKMVDCIVSTGASIVDMDFFEGMGYKHYIGRQDINDNNLREMYIDRIYDTFIDEEDLQKCDHAIKEIADSMPHGQYSSREFIREMGKYLQAKGKKKESLVQLAYEFDVPIFCPAFSDSSAGFGLVKHQWENPQSHVSIDSVKDFRELTMLKMFCGESGLFMVGGGVPKNFVQDTVVCAEVLGVELPMHKYAVQITVADVRDGACSSSTLKEASSWGKVNTAFEQMVYAEATTVVPMMVSYAYHSKIWEKREYKRLAKVFTDYTQEQIIEKAKSFVK